MFLGSPRLGRKITGPKTCDKCRVTGGMVGDVVVVIVGVVGVVGVDGDVGAESVVGGVVAVVVEEAS